MDYTFEDVAHVIRDARFQQIISKDPEPERKIRLPGDFDLETFKNAHDLSQHKLLDEPLGRFFMEKFADVTGLNQEQVEEKNEERREERKKREKRRVQRRDRLDELRRLRRERLQKKNMKKSKTKLSKNSRHTEVDDNDDEYDKEDEEEFEQEYAQLLEEEDDDKSDAESVTSILMDEEVGSKILSRDVTGFHHRLLMFLDELSFLRRSDPSGCVPLLDLLILVERFQLEDFFNEAMQPIKELDVGQRSLEKKNILGITQQKKNPADVEDPPSVDKSAESSKNNSLGHLVGVPASSGSRFTKEVNKDVPMDELKQSSNENQVHEEDQVQIEQESIANEKTIEIIEIGRKPEDSSKTTRASKPRRIDLPASSILKTRSQYNQIKYTYGELKEEVTKELEDAVLSEVDDAESIADVQEMNRTDEFEDLMYTSDKRITYNKMQTVKTLPRSTSVGGTEIQTMYSRDYDKNRDYFTQKTSTHTGARNVQSNLDLARMRSSIKSISNKSFREDLHSLRTRSVNHRLNRKIEQNLKPLYDAFIADEEMLTEYAKFKLYSVEKVEEKNIFYHRVLGQGAFGTVHGCVIAEIGVVLAMKTMNKKRVKLKKAQGQVQAERETLGALAEHPSPYCMQLRYAFQTKEFFHLLIPLAVGGDLKYHLRKGKTLSLSRARVYCAEIAYGLGHLHQLGFIMRDLKPRNILLDEEGHCKISDFGLAIEIRNGKHKGRAGTEGYWSPEVINDEEYAYDCDWWSYGCCMFELVAGVNPFSCSHTGYKTRNQGTRSGKIKFTSDFDPDAKDLVKRLLKIDKEKRICTTRNSVQTLMNPNHPFWKPLDIIAIRQGKQPAEWRPTRGVIYAARQQDIEAADDNVDEHRAIRKVKLNKSDVVQFPYYVDADMHQRDIIKIIPSNTKIPRVLKTVWDDNYIFVPPNTNCCTSIYNSISNIFN